MTFSLSKFNIFISTLNFVLCFVGYQLATSLFLPISSDLEAISQTVTIPYRGFALLISILVLILNLKKKIGKLPLALVIFWIYWIALIIRIFYDIFLRSDVNLNSSSQLWLYIFGIILITMFSIIKSYTKIDLEKALKWVYLGTALTMILSLFNNASLLIDSSEITGRASGNIALQTISFGHLGTMGIALSLFILKKGRINFTKKIFIILIMILSFLIMIRAGSRSPVLALAVIILFWMFARSKNVARGSFIAISIIILILIFMEPILLFIGDISPIMEIRLRMGIFEGNSSGRDVLISDAIKAFIHNPVFGEQFALFDYKGGFIYSHNIILDSLMGLGLFGGIAMIYILFTAIKDSFYLIKEENPHYWIGIILIQQIVLSMFSGAIYYNQIFNILFVFIFLYSDRNLLIKTKTNIDYADKN